MVFPSEKIIFCFLIFFLLHHPSHGQRINDTQNECVSIRPGIFSFSHIPHKNPLQVMKDWSDLEERYQDMRSEDPTSAEDFKKAMTERFQKTVQV